MPKKRKKGADNFPHLDLEQRRQYLERKALQEQEKTRKREELLECYLKIKLDDEKKKSNINESKLTEKWRNLLRKSKKDQLFTQLKIFCEGIQQVVTYMDTIIEFLTTSVKEAHFQRKLSSQRNISTVNSLINIHEAYIYVLMKSFRLEQCHLLNKHSTDIRKLKSQHCSYLNEIALMCSAASLISDKEEEKGHFLFQNSLAMAKVKLENEYLNAVNEEQKLLKEGWIMLAVSQKSHEEEVTHLRQQCQTYFKKYSANIKLKEKIEQEINFIQELQTLLDIANTISSLLNLCKRMETEDDKKIPFYSTNTEQLNQKKFVISKEIVDDQLRSAEGESEITGLAAGMETSNQDEDMIIKSFFRFWIKLNRVQIQCFSLIKEGKDLENENKNLKIKVKKYFSQNYIQF